MHSCFSPILFWLCILTFRIYNTNSEELICHLEERNLSSEGNFATLLERLVKAIKHNRDTRDPFNLSHTLTHVETTKLEETLFNYSGFVKSFHDENPTDLPYNKE